MLSRRWPGNVEAAGEREIHSGRSHHSHRRRGVSQGWRRVSGKDKGVIDETPGAYTVMAAQKDLVGVLHTLIQIICVKG